MDRSRWLTHAYPPAPPAPGGAKEAWQLFLFPHAGGGTTTYLSWAADLAPEIDTIAICPPGRERHIGVPAHQSMAPLVEELVAVLAPVARPPFAFFGHSLGALVAYEVGLALWQRGCGPAHLFASASRAPHVPGTVRSLLPLDDDALIAELARHGGIPDGLSNEPELLQLVLPPLRADLRIAAEYVAETGRPLPCAITAMGGAADLGVRPDGLAGWREQTTAALRVRLFAGDHFYLLPQRQIVLDLIRRDLPGPQAGLAMYPTKEVVR
jgi:surfactin synthase thioesterase subunit